MNKNTSSLVTVVWLLLLAALAATHTDAQTVPALINYQGKLVNSNGLPVSTGDYQLRFRIYDAVTNGNLIWGPQVFNGQTGPGYGPLVPVVQGWFNVILGPNDTNGIPIANAFAAPERYLEIQISTNSPFSPRQQILSAPFALRADFAAAATTAQTAATANNVSDGSITGAKIAAGSVGSTQLGVGAVQANNIATGAVGPLQVSLGAIGSAQIAPGAVQLTHLAPDMLSGFESNAVPAAAFEIGSYIYETGGLNGFSAIFGPSDSISLSYGGGGNKRFPGYWFNHHDQFGSDRVIAKTKFKKAKGAGKLRIFAQIWTQSSGTGGLKIYVNTNRTLVLSTTSTTPVELNGIVDVSSLTDGTYYNIEFELGGNGSPGGCYMSWAKGFYE
jgi:hypothetical protein